MRHGQHEQYNGNGLWFKVAPGSGMWVNVGNTAHLIDDTITSDLKEQCARLHHIYDFQTHTMYGGNKGPLPFFLYCAGFDSGQFYADGCERELIISTKEVHIRDDCSMDNILSKIKYCGPGENQGCGKNIEVRKWQIYRFYRMARFRMRMYHKI